MGEIMNRWKVTYTKHLKQKRKVYHDGFLDIHSSSNKTMLYDECEKLLGCRILKQDEVICSGETLIFNSFLVDIDTPLGDHKPESDLNVQKGDDKISEKSGVLRGKSIRNNSVCFASAEKNKTRPSFSPSHQIIREFKKRRLKCYGSPQTSPDTRKTEETEWQVLYTTNITQKAKKFHDGFLKLSICGSLGSQVMLFDENRKLLDSRFIKKHETVKSGESIAFDAHLVEIGECEKDHKPSKIPLNEGTSSGEGGDRVLHGQKSCFSENEISTGKEWNVLYTSQITKKSKKYQNGIIKISSSGSHQMQVTLLNEDRNILSSKHLSLSKNVRVGEKLELPKYLVEIGEACENVKVELGNRNFDIKKDASFCISGGDEKGSGRETTQKSLRDAHQILSILQRPRARVNLSSGHTDENISVSVSSRNPKPSLAEALHLPIDDQSHQKPSEGQNTRESIKNTENSQSTGLTQSTFTANAKTLTEDGEIGQSSKLLRSDHVEADSISLRNSIPRKSDSAACSLVNDDEGKICEEITYEREMHAFPSFDLGI